MSVLAPMVRLGTLPLRLLALERGAELVYSEEIVDAKLAKSQRVVDERLGTTDWRLGGGIVLRTCCREHGKLVVQLGTADAESALAAVAALGIDSANPLRDGIVGIDVNMGCPKTSALSGGTGSALFEDSERAEAVVTALRAALPPEIAVSCKVRLHRDGHSETLRRCLRLVSAGASTIAIHARHAGERSCDLAHWSEFGPLAVALHAQGAAVILNGDALDSVAACQMIASVPNQCNCRVMVGRGGLRAANGLFFHFGGASDDSAASDGADDKQTHADLDQATLDLCRRYAQIAIEFENPPLNTAFVLQWMLHARIQERSTSHQPSLQPEQQEQQQEAHLAQQQDVCGAPIKLTIGAAAKALRGASKLGTIAAALGLEGFLASCERGIPAAPTHRYTPTYFDHLDAMSDWARAPSRAALRLAHAVSHGAPLQTNDDFRRLVAARAALVATAEEPSASKPLRYDRAAGDIHTLGSSEAASPNAPSSSRDAPSSSRGAAAPRVASSDTVDPRSALFALVGPAVQVRFFVLREAEATERALGYFAKAWQCRAVVGGRPYDGALRKSRFRAEQDAAEKALAGLAVCPLRAKDAKRRAMRDAKRKRYK